MIPDDAISLTRKLITYDTVNPPGNEGEAAKYLGGLLEERGFNVEYLPYGEGRLHVVAEKGLSVSIPPVVLSGHLDTVPLGMKKWGHHPFSGEIAEGKIYGRGSSDMKGGVAAMIVASVLAFDEEAPKGGVRLIFTAGEELGCHGVLELSKSYKKFGQASGLIVGEPTSNVPVTGHKGGLYMKVSFRGKTAHSSMPELGVNAIYKAARSVLKLENFNFGAVKDPLLGYPTINVGTMNGGQNLNSVPDRAEFTIDVRSTRMIPHEEILQKLKKELGEDAEIEILVNMTPVSSNEEDPIIRLVYDACSADMKAGGFPRALPYLTDASVLQKVYKGVPTVILGPGQPEMAHQTDEYCYVGNILESVNIYKNILLKRRK